MSLEHGIEKRKTDYYCKLQRCLSQRSCENISSWLTFLSALRNVQQKPTANGAEGNLLSTGTLMISGLWISNG